jgi:hypothetical protein
MSFLSSALALLLILAIRMYGLQVPGSGIKTIEYPRETVASIRGKVVRNGTEERLQGVKVQLLDPGSRKVLKTITSESDGKFYLRTPNGLVRLRLYLLGYDIVEIDIKVDGKTRRELTIDLPIGT